MKNTLNDIKLLPNARLKIVDDFLSNSENEIANSKTLSIHAGALCLYSAILLTKIYETNPDEIQLEDSRRESVMLAHLKTLPKHKNLSEDNLKIKAHQNILRDIRNCFAHGNFTINYNSVKDDVYFILHPKRKDFNIDIPLIISKNSIQDAIMQSSLNFLSSNSENLDPVPNNLNNLLQMLLIPSQLLKIADYYFDTPSSNPFPINPKRHLLIQHILLIAQITYEQDEYYNIFGKSSNIFEKISLVRNSMAHNCFMFTEQAKIINYTDKQRILNETIIKSVSFLSSAQELKNTIKTAISKNHSQESIQLLKSQL